MCIAGPGTVADQGRAVASLCCKDPAGSDRTAQSSGVPPRPTILSGSRKQAGVVHDQSAVTRSLALQTEFVDQLLVLRAVPRNFHAECLVVCHGVPKLQLFHRRLEGWLLDRL